MDNNPNKKFFYYSFKNIKKIWLPIILTIFIVLNISFIPNSLGLNDNLNFQPLLASGETYFFPSSNFKNKNNVESETSRRIGLRTLILILFLIIAIIYFIVYKLKNLNKNKTIPRNEYLPILKEDSDNEKNI